MKELELICKKACESMGINIKSKKRSDNYVIGRHLYFDYARKKTDYSLEAIGSIVKKDHACVINSIKNEPKYMNHKFYLKNKPKFIRTVDEFYSLIEKEEMEKMASLEIENIYLKRKMTLIIVESYSVLKEMEKLKSISTPEEITTLLSSMNKEEVETFIKYSVRPKLKMRKSQEMRLSNYNPRQRKITA